MKTKVAVVGATGYTGGECVRYLLGHEGVEVVTLTARTPRPIEEVFPAFAGLGLPPVESFDAARIAEKAEWAFLCLPHGEAARAAEALVARGVRVVDLSADLRVGKKVGGKAVPYGLTELFREDLAGASVVANPGCYPTSILLAAAPVLAAGLGEAASVVAHAASGTTGAGRKERADLLFAEASENVKPYGLPRHRHADEIEFHLSRKAGAEAKVLFVPHLLPVRRGILTTVYLRSKASADEVRAAWRSAYEKEPFLRILPEGTWPSLAAVRGTNFCDLACHADSETGVVALFSAIDNLGKGAAGQAVQNFNLLAGYDETAGLLTPPLPV